MHLRTTARITRPGSLTKRLATVSRKNDMNDFDDYEADDYAILGSRYARIASGAGSQKFHRTRHDSDAGYEQAPKRKSFRTREKLHHDLTH